MSAARGTTRRPLRLAGACTGLVTALSIAGLLASGPAIASVGTVSTSADSTPGTDGRVSAIVQIGSRIFIGGSFTTVGGLPRHGLAALDATTGAVDPSWSADVSGSVLALAASPSGGSLYVGGTFSAVNGVARANVAAVSTAAGAVSPWNPSANNSVLALAAYSNSVLAGGKFGSIGGAYAGRLAVLDATTGRASTAFLPRPDGYVSALTVAPTQTSVYVGGGFTHIGGQTRPNLAAVSLSNGAATSWYPDATGCPVLSSVLAPGGGRLFVACAGASNSVAAYNPAASGPRVWRAMGDGNVQSVTLLNSTVYIGGHFTVMSGQSRRKAAAFDATTGAMSPWNPTFDSPLGIWAICATGNGVWTGGDFTTVNGRPQPHLARFALIA